MPTYHPLPDPIDPRMLGIDRAVADYQRRMDAYRTSRWDKNYMLVPDPATGKWISTATSSSSYVISGGPFQIVQNEMDRANEMATQMAAELCEGCELPVYEEGTDFEYDDNGCAICAACSDEEVDGEGG